MTVSHLSARLSPQSLSFLFAKPFTLETFTTLGDMAKLQYVFTEIIFSIAWKTVNYLKISCVNGIFISNMFIFLCQPSRNWIFNNGVECQQMYSKKKREIQNKIIHDVS